MNLSVTRPESVVDPVIRFFVSSAMWHVTSPFVLNLVNS